MFLFFFHVTYYICSLSKWRQDRGINENLLFCIPISTEDFYKNMITKKNIYISALSKISVTKIKRSWWSVNYDLPLYRLLFKVNLTNQAVKKGWKLDIHILCFYLFLLVYRLFRDFTGKKAIMKKRCDCGDV